MAKVNERRINYNDDDYETLKRLMVEEPFRSLNLIDIFAISLIYGKKAGIRTPLDKKKLAVYVKQQLKILMFII